MNLNISALMWALLALLCLQWANAFRPASLSAFSPSRVLAKTNKLPTATTLYAKADDGSQYWQGEWVCADCGYIYDRDFDGEDCTLNNKRRDSSAHSAAPLVRDMPRKLVINGV